MRLLHRSTFSVLSTLCRSYFCFPCCSMLLALNVVQNSSTFANVCVHKTPWSLTFCKCWSCKVSCEALRRYMALKNDVRPPHFWCATSLSFGKCCRKVSSVSSLPFANTDARPMRSSCQEMHQTEHFQAVSCFPTEWRRSECVMTGHTRDSASL